MNIIEGHREARKCRRGINYKALEHERSATSVNHSQPPIRLSHASTVSLKRSAQRDNMENFNESVGVAGGDKFRTRVIVCSYVQKG